MLQQDLSLIISVLYCESETAVYARWRSEKSVSTIKHLRPRAVSSQLRNHIKHLRPQGWFPYQKQLPAPAVSVLVLCQYYQYLCQYHQYECKYYKYQQKYHCNISIKIKHWRPQGWFSYQKVASTISIRVSTISTSASTQYQKKAPLQDFR